MPAENSFRRLLQEHLRATKAGRFGQFEYSWLNEPNIGQTFEGDFAPPIRPNRGGDFFLQIRIDDGTPLGRPWVTGDPLPASADYTSELSVAANPGVTPARSAGRFSEFVNDQSLNFSSARQGPFGATVTDPVSNVITLSEQFSPPLANVDASVLSPVSVTFTVVPVLTAVPNPAVWTSFGARPALIIEVFNTSATQNLEGFYFNGPPGFIYRKVFTPQETLAQNVPSIGNDPGAVGFARWNFNASI